MPAAGCGRSSTLRADFFDRPLDYPEFGELVHRGLVTVAMPDQDSLALMVSQPARQAGLDLEPGLVTEVVRDVMEQPGGLPLMQYALTELAQRSDGRTLTTDGYRESGGVLGGVGAAGRGDLSRVCSRRLERLPSGSSSGW